jgi:tetratricopeptide (TPR) repeat protein
MGMAEGVLGGILGEEVEKPDVEAVDALARAEAFAAAVAAIASRQDPQVARDTSEFLQEQARLLKVQKKHLEDEHALRLESLAGNIRESRLRRLGFRFRIVFQSLVVLLVASITLGIAVLAWDASRDTGLVVEAFSVPPDLAQRGMTGEVVARELLDHLTELQSATKTARTERSYRNAWGDDIKIALPETGVSLGELKRFLHDNLGHAAHITGELIQSGTGLTVVVRTGEDRAQRVSGSDGDLGTLLRQAAESIYAQTQPYRYATYLTFSAAADVTPERRSQGKALLEQLAQDPDREERAWAYGALARYYLRVEIDPQQEARAARGALEAKPGFVLGRYHLVFSAYLLGHDEDALRAAKEYLADDQSLRESVQPARRRVLIEPIAWLKSQLSGDYAAATREALTLGAQPQQTDLYAGPRQLAASRAAAHDYDAVVDLSTRIGNDPANKALFLGQAALDRDVLAAIPLLAEAVAARSADGRPASIDLALRTDGPWLALARAQVRDLAGATALIATTPLDCYLCVRMRGRIAALSGNSVEAQRWFAEAIRQAPTLPQTYVDRGVAVLASGDIAASIEDAEHATRLSPHYADAWKLWGDAMARRGNWKDAARKYDEALKYSPMWKQLQEARGALTKRKV